MEEKPDEYPKGLKVAVAVEEDSKEEAGRPAGDGRQTGRPEVGTAAMEEEPKV